MLLLFLTSHTFKNHRKSSPNGRTFVTFSKVALNCNPNFYKNVTHKVKQAKTLCLSMREALLTQTYPHLGIYSSIHACVVRKQSACAYSKPSSIHAVVTLFSTNMLTNLQFIKDKTST